MGKGYLGRVQWEGEASDQGSRIDDYYLLLF